ncbi:diguanylate cyclase domain-containing protein [Amphritea sp. HPY]|uniref:diguanylate cyclase domain-containing protein n=1 Tax=Amphritea sp. HPY TaxID=3421652 RepID=UPI003D7C4C06
MSNFSSQNIDAPQEIDEAVFITQTDLLLERGIRSKWAILAGGVVFACVLYYYNTPLQLLIPWYLALIFSSYMLARACRSQPDKNTLKDKASQLLWRTVFSCMSAFLYGVSVFLLPQAVAEIAIAMLFTILVIAVTVTVVICINFPHNYIAFDLAAMLPVQLYFLLNWNVPMLLLTLIMLIGHIAFTPMAFHLSRISKQAIRANLLLQREIEEHIQSKKQVQHLALHDHLTGVANRRHFEDHAENMIEAAETFGIIFIDLDDFKQVNDSFGHKIGDQVLRVVAERISRQIKSSDFVARLGGDEFCILIQGGDTRASLNRVARDIASAFSAPILIEDLQLQLTCSTGSALYPDNALELDALISIADHRMYDHKKNSKPVSA